MPALYLALPDNHGNLVACGADGDPTDDKIPWRVRVTLTSAEIDGLVLGDYIALWTNDPAEGVRIVDFVESEPDTYDLPALWAVGTVL